MLHLLHMSWVKMGRFRRGITKRLTTAMPAIFIILAVGIIVGSWMFSGTVPAFDLLWLKSS